MSKQGRDVLRRYGLGLSQLLIMEYQLEIGADISEHMLSIDLMRKELHSHGVKETEFVLAALLVWTLCASGQIDHATDLLMDFRIETEKEDMPRLLSNIDALYCRLSLMGDKKYSESWFTEQAPREVHRILPLLGFDSLLYSTGEFLCRVVASGEDSQLHQSI